MISCSSLTKNEKCSQLKENPDNNTFEANSKCLISLIHVDRFLSAVMIDIERFVLIAEKHFIRLHLM